MGTVGAVAINSQGGVAAAVSTGGLSLKLPGRVGDSAIIGAGLYADNEAGACVATGIGEHAIRSCIAKTAVEFMRNGLNAQESVIKALKDAGKRIKGLYLGLIAVDREGEVGAAHTTPHMLWGKMVEGEKPVVSVRATLLT
ncbi:hypothetical protein DRN86_03690 [Candidatus Geothermarchaeota archaeon]|nr:MAG: hypothetical protein DRN86_03690 [Candidatus Geothermarchaeota archaeon]